MDFMPLGLMNLYMDYNGKVGDIKGCERSIKNFERIARTADTPEERQRYAQAAKNLKERLPQLKQEAKEIAKELGVSDRDPNKPLTMEDLEELKGKKLGLQKESDGSLSMVNEYSPGSYLSKKT